MTLIKKIINKYNSIDSKLYALFNKDRTFAYKKNITFPISIVGFISFNILFITTSDFKYNIISHILTYIIGCILFSLFIPIITTEIIRAKEDLKKIRLIIPSINIPVDNEENDQNEDEYYEPTKEEMIEKMKNSYFKVMVH